MMTRCMLLLAIMLVTVAALGQGYDFAAEREDLSPPGETLAQATEQAAQALQQTKMRFTISTVGFDITAGSEAEQYLQATAKTGGGGYFTASDTGQLSAALSSAAQGRTSTTPAPTTDAILLIEPKDGSTVGPNLDINGRTGAGAVVVIYCIVFDAQTNKQIRMVPGIRSRAKETGEFTFRIATPRISFGAGETPPRLRYELHTHTVRADGAKGPETIVNLFSPA